MSKQSRARAAAKVGASVKASAASYAPLPSEPKTFLARWGTLLACIIIVIAALATYANSFSGPFIFDDYSAITYNPTIRHWLTALSPPSDLTIGGRPMLNLTFAVNYAVGSMNVWGYHGFNLLVHMLAGLALFGIVRRTLLRPMLSGRFGIDAVPLAFAVAIIWIVHPLQTEAVTYISQRAESLMGLFYLLTLYCFIRSVESTAPVNWQILSVTACLFGALSKEVIVTAPVIIVLYDRSFIAGSFRDAWRQRWRYYLGLTSMWLLLARLVIDLNQRSVGFGQGVSWWHYSLTSCRSIVLYLKLAIWPHPLVFDYGTNLVQHAPEVLPYAFILAVLLVGTAIALWRWPVIGFAGAWVFVILAPASSVVPVVFQPMAEHRMYLSLAAIAALVVLGFHAWIGRRALLVIAVAAVGFSWLSFLRNHDYRSELAIWSDTIEKCPNNERAHNGLAAALAKDPSRLKEAITEYEAALRIKPDYAEAHYSLGAVLAKISGRLPEAISHYEAALWIEPDNAMVHYNLGVALAKTPNRSTEAIVHFEAALRIEPNLPEAHNNLGVELVNIPGRLPEAISAYETALQLKPNYAEAHYNLGAALAKIPGRLPEAISEYEAALRIRPDYAEAHFYLGNALVTIPGRVPDALFHYEEALRIKPDFAEVHGSLGNVLFKILGRVPDAISQYKAALKINPNLVEAHYNLGNAYLQQGRYSSACEQYEEVLKLKPDLTEAHVNLGITLANMGRLNDAIAQFQTALQMKPDDSSAQENLELVRKMLTKNYRKNLSERPAP